MKESSEKVIFDLASSFEHALSAHRQGSYEAAIHEYQKILSFEKNHRPSLLNLGVIFHVKKSYELSLDYFLKVLDLDENDISGLYNTGKTLQSQKEWSRSLEYLKKANDLAPNDAMISKAMGMGYFELGLYSESSKMLARYLDSNRDDADALYTYSESVQSLGQFDLAAFGFKRVIDINPEHEKAFERLSDCYASQNRLEKSVSTLKHLLELRKNDSGIYRKLAMYYGQLKNYSEARKCYWKAYALESKEMKIHETKAVSVNSDIDRATFQTSILNITEKYATNGNWKGALGEFTALSRRYPNSTVILQEIAYIYQIIGESKRSASYYEKILKREPDNLESMLQLTRIAMDLEDFDYGLRWVNKALEKYSDVVEVKELAGALHTHFAKYETALEFFGQCKQSKFDSCGVLLGSSECFIGQGEYAKAADLLKGAVKIFPDSVELTLNLARSFLALDKHKEAANLMKQARKKFVSDLQVLAVSAEVSIAYGNFKRAREFFATISKLQPHEKEDYVPYIKSLIHTRQSDQALRYLKAFTRFKMKNFNHLYLESLAYVVGKNAVRASIPWQELWSLNPDAILAKSNEVKTIINSEDSEFLLQIQGDINRLFSRKEDVLEKVELFFRNIMRTATLEVVK